MLAVLHARLQSGTRDLVALVNPLMWMIVLPYLGPAAAASELRRASPGPAVTPSMPAKSLPEGLEMRLTYRTVRVLAAIGDEPGGSNLEIGARAGIADQGQISKLLTRLARLDLIENTGAGQRMGTTNAWHLTDRGEELDSALRRELAAGGSPRGRR